MSTDKIVKKGATIADRLLYNSPFFFFSFFFPRCTEQNKFKEFPCSDCEIIHLSSPPSTNLPNYKYLATTQMSLHSFVAWFHTGNVIFVRSLRANKTNSRPRRERMPDVSWRARITAPRSRERERPTQNCAYEHNTAFLREIFSRKSVKVPQLWPFPGPGPNISLDACTLIFSCWAANFLHNTRGNYFAT